MEQDFILRLNQLIDQNIESAEFSADDICRELTMSRSQLFRMVKAHTDLSISLYIRKRKLQKAQELLQTTDLKIAEVSYRIGLDSPQSFTKYFIQEFGVSPRDFKKNPTATPPKQDDDTAATDAEAEPTEPLDIEESEPETPLVEVSVAPTPVVAPRSRKKQWLLIGSIAVLVLLSSAFLLYKKNGFGGFETESATENLEKSIAVMPFRNLGTPETALFAESIMDQIHSNLAIIEELRIISKAAAEKVKDKSNPEIAANLGVNFILEGKVLQVNNTLQVSLDLTNAVQNRVIWSKTYTVATSEALSLNFVMIQDLVKELKQKLTEGEQQRLAKRPTQDIETYNLYLQGKLLVQDRNKDEMKAAVAKFDEALARDPKFVDAYAYKALTYFVGATMDYFPRDSAVTLAERNALKAIQMDAQNGLAYGVIASIYRIQNKWEQCVTTHVIALKHSPNDAQINYWFGIALRSIGQMDKAIEYGERAIKLDPLHPLYIVGLANSYAYAGRLEAADKVLKDSKHLFGNSASYCWATGFYYIFRKDYQAACKEFQTGAERGLWMDSSYQGMMAYCQGKLGQTDAALRTIATIPPTTVSNCSALAMAYAGMGNADMCLQYIAWCAERRASPDYIMVSPVFAFLHDDPRFKAILDKLGLLNLDIEL